MAWFSSCVCARASSFNETIRLSTLRLSVVSASSALKIQEPNSLAWSQSEEVLVGDLPEIESVYEQRLCHTHLMSTHLRIFRRERDFHVRLVQVLKICNGDLDSWASSEWQPCSAPRQPAATQMRKTIATSEFIPSVFSGRSIAIVASSSS